MFIKDAVRGTRIELMITFHNRTKILSQKGVKRMPPMAPRKICGQKFEEEERDLNPQCFSCKEMCFPISR